MYKQRMVYVAGSRWARMRAGLCSPGPHVLVRISGGRPTLWWYIKLFQILIPIQSGKPNVPSTFLQICNGEKKGFIFTGSLPVTGLFLTTDGWNPFPLLSPLPCTHTCTICILICTHTLTPHTHPCTRMHVHSLWHMHTQVLPSSQVLTHTLMHALSHSSTCTYSSTLTCAHTCTNVHSHTPSHG